MLLFARIPLHPVHSRSPMCEHGVSDSSYAASKQKVKLQRVLNSARIARAVVHNTTCALATQYGGGILGNWNMLKS